MMFRLKKIPSGALQFTIFISVLIGLMLAGILLLTYANSFFRNQNAVTVSNINICNNGVLKLCAQNYKINDTIRFDMIDVLPGQQLKAIVRQWGTFDLASITANYRKIVYTKFAFLGGKVSPKERNAIYLSETYKPLALVGITKIRGNVYLPDQGVRGGNILGHSYYNKSFVEGKINVSSEFLPKLKYNYREVLNAVKHFVPAADSDYISLKQEEVSNSFSVSTKGYFSDATIILDNVSLKGNIIIRSAEKIIVKKNAHLTDVILYAPVVVFEDNVSATVQVIAEEKIEVKNNCHFSYPSAFVLSEMKDVQKKGIIYIGRNTKISGMIYYFRNDTINQFNYYPTNIYLAPTSEVVGEVYCEGNFELRGVVIGMVYTDLFLTREQGTIYLNHLYDAEINANDLHYSYGGMLWDENAKAVMKWGY